jgi:hypothetical protein
MHDNSRNDEFNKARLRAAEREAEKEGFLGQCAESENAFQLAISMNRRLQPMSCTRAAPVQPIQRGQPLHYHGSVTPVAGLFFAVHRPL